MCYLFGICDSVANQMSRMRIKHAKQQNTNQTMDSASSKSHHAIKTLRERLHLKNCEVFDTVGCIINEVQTLYPHDMNWKNEFPYECIYHKKHSQIILRFRFNTCSPSVVRLSAHRGYSTPWIEYNASKGEQFWLVTVLNDAA